MSRWSFRAVVANLAASAAAVLFLLAATPAGGLWVTTLPTAADVWLDGVYVGRSPLVIDALGAGEHRLALTRSGWTPQDLTVTVIAGATTPAAVLLQRSQRSVPGTGTLALHGLRAQVVSVDGDAAPPAKDGTLALAAGMHEIGLIVAGGRTTRTVTVYPQSRTDVVVEGDAEPRSVVIAPADDYLPAAAVHVEGTRVTLRYAGHDVAARMGASGFRVDRKEVTYDGAPTLINGRLYLPLELLTLLNPTANAKK